MCFSPEMDLVAGVVVGGIGIDTVRLARRPAERLLAALPLLFGAHQFVEAFVWWGLQGRVGAGTGSLATHLYVAIALWIVPAVVPLAILLIEPADRRARGLLFVGLGAAVALDLFVVTLLDPVGASIEGHHLRYDVHPPYGLVISGLYVLATCGPLLLSGQPHLRRYGVINLVAVGALTLLSQSGFISLWCFWAAVTSVAIDLHLRYQAPPPLPRRVKVEVG